MLLEEWNIQQDWALVKRMRFVANGTAHTIGELGRVFRHLSDTGFIHPDTKYLMIFETIWDYE